MRSAKKSVLKNFLQKGLGKTQEIKSTKIADDGALLWCCDWKEGKLFQEICQNYVTLLHKLKISVIVFDGYSFSTKDTIRKKRSGGVSNTADIKDINPCPADRNTFLSNYANKEAFVKFLGSKFELLGYDILQCPSDADTTIVKVTLNSNDDKPVTICSDDTDILCLLIHHRVQLLDTRDIYLINMTWKKGTKQPECFNIKDITNNLDQLVIQYLLFAHDFTGCDTTSAIYKFGKIAIFKKIHDSKHLKNFAAEFYNNNKLPEDIGNTECLYSSIGSTLAQSTKKKYDEMVMSNRSDIDPSILPPSTIAAFFHLIRVYHQIKVWCCLSNIEPLNWVNWGWEMKKESLNPILTDKEPCPQELLLIIRCSCKESCGKRYSCRKDGMKCSKSCKDCLGVTCENTLTEICESSLEVDDGLGLDDRHFLDAFC